MQDMLVYEDVWSLWGEAGHFRPVKRCILTPMASLMNTRGGRPSKGPRHSFTVKLDLERAAKLTKILRTLDTNGIEYLTPIVEAHIDSIDSDHLRNEPRERRTAVAENGTTSTSRSAVKRKLSEEEKLRRAQMLARKINLLIDSRMDESGRPYDYRAIEASAKNAGVFISRTRWSRLKNGQVQVVPDACLRALATVFDVNREYLLHEDAELPEEVEVMLPHVRIKRLSEVRDFAARKLGRVDPEGLRATTKILDEAIQS